MAKSLGRRDMLAILAGASAYSVLGAGSAGADEFLSLVLTNGKVTTLDPSTPEASAVGIARSRFAAVGSEEQVMALAGPRTRVVDVGGRRVVPGLIDGHTHAIRAGLNYNMELRWDGVPSLADALRMLRRQAEGTPAPQWVRVVGGFSEYQFAERRMPTLRELNEAAPETPVFILRLYDRAMLNRAALRAVGFTRHTKDLPGSLIERDRNGHPTGMLLAKPSASLLYETLAKGPKLSWDDQLNSTRHFMRELNRLGVTSVIDAGGGSQSYPHDYQVVEHLSRTGQLTVRIAYSLFPQRPNQELADFRRWAHVLTPGQGNAMYRHIGAGEMLAYSAADYEHFVEPRPDLPTGMTADLEPVVRHLAHAKWPFRLHATYDETISQALQVLERVNAEVPLSNVRWFFDHAETISAKSIERVKALGGGIAVQDRMAYQGEDFVRRYGRDTAAEAPPIRRILAAGVPLGAGTDATRVASYNPWVSLSWLITGKTIGGMTIYPKANRVDRVTALRLWTEANAWFSSEEQEKGAIKVGQRADLAVLTADYMSIPEDGIKNLASVLTVVDGTIVHGDGPFSELAAPLPPPSPDWSPVSRFGGYYKQGGAP